MALESSFQGKLIKELQLIFPDSIILKNDANYIQGIPDILILFRDRWAALECKKFENASKQANQGYYVDKMDRMSYAAFIYPENKRRVLDELQTAFRFRR